MILDFHSHMASEDSIVCTDTPTALADGQALMRFVGLLPDKWTEALEDNLYDKLSSDETLNLGEVGLDRRFQDRIPIEKQIQILRRELSFAIERNRSISLHCVRATGPMIDILSELRYRPFSILWHGFSGSPETAAQLYRLGVIVSVGPRFSGERKKIFSANPMTVLETDYTGTDKNRHLEILESQYRATEEAIGREKLLMGCAEALKIFGNNQNIIPSH